MFLAERRAMPNCKNCHCLIPATKNGFVSSTQRCGFKLSHEPDISGDAVPVGVEVLGFIVDP